MRNQNQINNLKNVQTLAKLQQATTSKNRLIQLLNIETNQKSIALNKIQQYQNNKRRTQSQMVKLQKEINQKDSVQKQIRNNLKKTSDQKNQIVKEMQKLKLVQSNLNEFMNKIQIKDSLNKTNHQLDTLAAQINKKNQNLKSYQEIVKRIETILTKQRITYSNKNPEETLYYVEKLIQQKNHSAKKVNQFKEQIKKFKQYLLKLNKQEENNFYSYRIQKISTQKKQINKNMNEKKQNNISIQSENYLMFFDEIKKTIQQLQKALMNTNQIKNSQSKTLEQNKINIQALSSTIITNKKQFQTRDKIQKDKMQKQIHQINCVHRQLQNKKTQIKQLLQKNRLSENTIIQFQKINKINQKSLNDSKNNLQKQRSQKIFLHNQKIKMMQQIKNQQFNIIKLKQSKQKLEKNNINQKNRYEQQVRQKIQYINKIKGEKNNAQQSFFDLKTKSNQFLKRLNFDLSHLYNTEIYFSLNLADNQFQFFISKIKNHLHLEMMFSNSQIIQEIQSKNFLIDKIQNLNKKAVKKIKLIYHYDPFNNASFHSYIDNCENVLIMCKLKTGAKIGAYSAEAFREHKLESDQNAGKGLFFSIDQLRAFNVRKDYNKSLLSAYEPSYLIIGNAEMRIKVNQKQMYVNFGSKSGCFDNEEVSTREIIKQDDRYVDMEYYEIYQLYL